MSAPKHSVKVSILNEEFTIRSDTAPEHTKAVAQYLDHAARQVLQSSGIIEANRAVILAALRITGELFEERQAAIDAAKAMRALADEVRPLLPPAKRKTESV